MLYFSQHPQCEGVHKDRQIFSPEDLPPSPILYTPSCHWSVKENKHCYRLNAGSAHGLGIHDEVTVYPQKPALGGQPIGTLLIGTIDNFSATLSHPPGGVNFTWTTDIVAIKSKRGRREILRLTVPSHENNLLTNLLQSPSDKIRNISFASEGAHCSFIKDNDADDFSMQVTDPRVTVYQNNVRFRHGDPILREEFPQVVSRALEYQWELDRTNRNHPLRPGIEVEFYELRNTSSPYFEEQDDLSVISSGNLYQNNEVHLETCDRLHNIYGIKITNMTSQKIYPKVYYFNPELLSIGQWTFLLAFIYDN